MSWLQQQNQEREDYEDDEIFRHKRNWRDLVCTDTTKGWLFIVAFAVIMPVLVYFLVTNTPIEEDDGHYTCSVQSTYRISCGKKNISAAECDSISCCFDKTSNQCYHYLPSKYYYTLNNKSNIYKSTQKLTPFKTNSSNSLQLVINEKTENIVSITLKEANDVTFIEDQRLANKNYNIRMSKEKLLLEILRADTNEVIFSTTRGPLIASENYWEWNIYLEGSALFGINQTFINLTENANFSKVIYKNRNDHYSHPILWAYKNGSFHGIKLKHDGLLEIKILPSSLIVLRSLSNQNIEIELALGPTPALLHDQQSSSFTMPPEWVLETHMCRRGDNLDLAKIIKQFSVVDSSKSFCIDDNLFMAIMKNNLTSPDILLNFSSIFDLQNKKFVLSLPPQILVNTSLHAVAEQSDILYNNNGSSYKGKYLNEEVVYPDYHHEKIQTFIESLSNLLSEYLNLTIDGIILDDNWPVDSTFKMNGSMFPYFSEEMEQAMSNTIPWNLTTPSSSTLQMINHNSYGLWQLEALKAFYSSSNSDSQPFLMSASNSIGQIEPMLIQNVDASWENLNAHLQNILFNSIIGNHLVSLPICGDNQNYKANIHETLCIRWYFIAATMPVFRISSINPWREPNLLYTKFAAKQANYALERRRWFLPIYQTILSKNQPVIRPMFYDFYEDNSTFALNSQYMIGDNILIVQPLTSGVNELQIYLPSRINIWYELWAGEMFNSTDDPWINVSVRENDFVAFIAQGTVVPLKVDDTLNLIVGLNCTATCTANTNLLLESYLEFSVDENSVKISNLTSDCNYKLGSIQLYLYANGTRVDRPTYEKNVDICTGETSVTINFVEVTTAAPTTNNSR